MEFVCFLVKKERKKERLEEKEENRKRKLKMYATSYQRITNMYELLKQVVHITTTELRVSRTVRD
jgi:uncharacterized protein YfbU (UPF0304 family)